MVSFKQAAILAFAGLTYAIPMAHRHRDDFNGPFTGRLPGMQGYGTETESTTIVVVPTKPEVEATTQTTQAAAKQTTAAVQFSSGTQTETEDSGSSSSSSTNTGASSGTGYMAIVNEYRSKGGLPALTQSSKLEANALKTANDGNGQMVHELNSGSFAQVLAPGTASNFESVYVGGWLCERPSLAGLNGICSSMTKGWSHDGQTGHADILSSSKYKSIGCALGKGIWACDLA